MPNTLFEPLLESWWDEDYFYRRYIEISAEAHGSYGNFTVVAGHPIEFALPYADLLETNKVRADFLDIEVLYYTNDLVPQWIQLPREVIPDEENDQIIVRFLLYEDLTDLQNYYVYYASETASRNTEGGPTFPSPIYFPSLTNFPRSDTQLVPSVWPIVLNADNPMLDYTRRLDHWKFQELLVEVVNDIVTLTYPGYGQGYTGIEHRFTRIVDTPISVASALHPKAKISLEFQGPAVQVRSVFGPAAGIGLVTIDKEKPVNVDLYAPTMKVATCYEVFDLDDSTPHRITFEATPLRNPVSRGTDVNIVGIDFYHQYDVYVSSETVRPSISWEASSGGG